MIWSVYDLQALSTCERLAHEFGLQQADLADHNPGQVTMGIEIEVPWSSFFPGLWSEFGLAGRKVASLSAAELAELSRRCAVAEQDLLPKLHSTVACGVPRGNDRYWEFSLPPAHDAGLIAEQVRLMSAAGVLPRDKPHSLHVTLGDLPRCPDIYYLCTLLEVEFVDPLRIKAGIEQTRQTIHTGWARKGLAGVFQKGPDELQGGAAMAAEIRMLQLPVRDDDFLRLMRMVQWCSSAIADRLRGHRSDAASAWVAAMEAVKRSLLEEGFPLVNWSRGGQKYEVWERFVESMPRLRSALQPTCSLLMSAALHERFAIESPFGDDQFSTTLDHVNNERRPVC